MELLIPLTLGLFVAGLIALIIGRSLRRKSGLPAGKVRYSDTDRRRGVPPPLFSQRYGLSGRPDYLVQAGRHIIPVEVKSRRAPASPHQSHVLQLAAYCLLVEESYGRRPPYGILRYADHSFRIPYSRDLRSGLLKTLEEMQAVLASPEAPRRTDDVRRCQRCSYASDCSSRQ